MKLLSAILVFAAAAVAQGVDFAGAYASSEMRVQLRPAPLGGFSGTIEIKGQQLPIKATAAGATLQGSFEAAGQPFPFTATLTGNQLRLVSEGHEYLLSRAIPAPAGGAVHRHANGFSVQPPAGWSATDKDQGVLMQPPGAAPEEVYIALIQEGYSPQEEASSVRQLSEAFLKNATSVQRAGDREPFPGGAAYHWEVVNPQTRQLVALSIYVAPNGPRAHLIVAAGPAANVRAQLPALVPVVQSIRYQPAPPAPLSNVTRPWDQKLRGKVVRQFWASQGMSSDKKHYLNADGSYRYWSNSMVSVDVPGASAGSVGKNNQTGRWSIVERAGAPYLQVTYTSGESKLFAITQDATNWYLNGEKAFAVEP
jgi:hypothetical protein